MSNLTILEKLKLERYFDMGGGYVCDFSNRTMQEFVLDTVKIDIYSSKYEYESGSKANRLRSFWSNESNSITGKLLSQLIEYWKAQQMYSGNFGEQESALYEDCLVIAKRLLSDSEIENLDVLIPNSDDKDFSRLSENIRKSVEQGEPEIAIDRLHTFTVKYLRNVCRKHNIRIKKDTALHILMGSYVKHLRESGLIRAKMTAKILGSSVQILEAFNNVRNDASYAHDNELLGYEESVLVFNSVTSSIKFVQSIETAHDASQEKGDEEDEFPF